MDDPFELAEIDILVNQTVKFEFIYSSTDFRIWTSWKIVKPQI